MEADASIAIVVTDRLCVTALSLSSGFDVVGEYDNDGVGGNDGGEVGETIDIQNVIKDVTVVSNGRVSDVIH